MNTKRTRSRGKHALIILIISLRSCSIVNRFGREFTFKIALDNRGRHHLFPKIIHFASLSSLRSLRYIAIVDPCRGIFGLSHVLDAVAFLLPLELLKESQCDPVAF